MNYRCIIVDDEKLARTLLEGYISKFPHLELVAQCRNPVEAMDVLQSERIDIMLLDIQMPELTGVEFLKTLKSKPEVIFTTAYSEYAVEGYQLDVSDYLLKPISFERFVQAMNKTIDKIVLKRGVSRKDEDFIAVHADYKIYKLRLSDIEYIEGLKEYVSYFTKDKRIIALESLKRLEDILPEDRFVRIHRSYIVPLEKIRAVEGNQVEIGNKKLPIGRSYKDRVMAKEFGNSER
jgi:DNA-binding LytR/AlgR family response regulator